MISDISAVEGRQLALSCDPAQTGDYAALTLARHEGSDTNGRPIVRLLGMTRQKKVSYEVQVMQIVNLTRRLLLPPYNAGGVTQILDSGGVGKPLLDHLRSASPLSANARGISMHGGMRSWTSQSEGITRASKVDVVTALNNSFISKRLVYDPETPGIDLLDKEVLNLRQTTTAAGSVKIAAGRGHDDVLFSVAYIVYLMAEGPTGETAGWAESTVQYWDAINNAKPPAEIEGGMPDHMLRDRGEMDRARKSSYRFKWS